MCGPTDKIWSTLNTALHPALMQPSTADIYLRSLWPLTFGSCQRCPLIKEESHQRPAGFLLYSRCSVRLYAGFKAFSIQRASARASCYRVTTQTGLAKRSRRPLGEDETLPQGRDLLLRCLSSICFMNPDLITDSN